MSAAIEIIRADITTLDVDVIVNAANAALSGGGGVDGAIHRAAGPGLLAECRALRGAKIGEVKLTAGHALKARFVAHAVGPVWKGGEHGEDALLAGVYTRSLELTVERGLASIAFPSISTGAYRFPPERAARLAYAAVRAFVSSAPGIERVVFCCFDDAAVRLYTKVSNA